MQHFTHPPFANQVWSLYHKVFNEAAHVQGTYPTSYHQYSAYNLMAFLAYRKYANTDFLRALRSRGLCLSSPEHVIQSLQILCYQLGLISGANFIENPHMLAKKRREDILGTKPHHESPHIMLTLDPQMISSPIIEQFLLNGMTIARINCAYNDESTWKQMIDSVRRAEDRLRKEGRYGHRQCKIYMDLAGPKIRVGPMRKIASPLKISVKRKIYETSAEAKKGLLTWHTIDPERISRGSYDFVISIQPHEKSQNLTAGDTLTFIDCQNFKREFLITAATPSGFEVSIGQTAYVDEHTIFQNLKHKVFFHVTEIEKKPARIRVKKSDRLRLLLKETAGSGNLTEDAVPCISVSIPEALANLKKGHAVLIDDGKIQGMVTECGEHFVELEITFPETYVTIQENKGIHLPDTDIRSTVPFLTTKDKQDLQFIVRNADMIGISFVHTPRDLQRLKQMLSMYGQLDIPVIAKIETREAVYHFSKILLEGLTFPKFGVMVARGDLAIHAGFQQLSIIQEEILAMCRAAHTPVILATQVLDTLARKGIPSRSELADLSLGSEFDCIMLNKGPFIKEAVKFLQDTLLFISEMKNDNQSITRKH